MLPFYTLCVLFHRATKKKKTFLMIYVWENVELTCKGKRLSESIFSMWFWLNVSLLCDSLKSFLNLQSLLHCSVFGWNYQTCCGIKSLIGLNVDWVLLKDVGWYGFWDWPKTMSIEYWRIPSILNNDRLGQGCVILNFDRYRKIQRIFFPLKKKSNE